MNIKRTIKNTLLSNNLKNCTEEKKKFNESPFKLC